MKQTLCTAAGLIGGAIVGLLGGWDMALQTLVLLMCVDYATGLVVAAVFKRSGKSENGKLESRAGWKGLCKKGMTLAVILVANRLDLMLGVNYIRSAAAIGFVANEAISILENAALMGINIGKPLTNALEILKGKSEQEQ